MVEYRHLSKPKRNFTLVKKKRVYLSKSSVEATYSHFSDLFNCKISFYSSKAKLLSFILSFHILNERHVPPMLGEHQQQPLLRKDQSTLLG